MSRVVQIPACTAGGVHIRAVVLSDDRGAGGGLVLNAEFLRFAAHWRFLPRSCRPYRAQTKGKVERPIRYIRENFFYGRSFVNDDDLNEQAVRWLEGTANVRRHATTGERPIDCLMCRNRTLDPSESRPSRPVQAQYRWSVIRLRTLPPQTFMMSIG